MLLQLIAMASMLMDHIGLVFYPNDYAWRFVGRLAMPLYTYLLVVGYARTRSFSKYVLRLSVIAVVSQIPYGLALKATNVNIVGTFMVVLIVFWAMDRNEHISLKAVFALIGGLFLEVFPFDYGAYALALAMIYKYTKGMLTIWFHLLLEVAAILVYGWVIQFFSLLASLLMVYYESEGIEKNAQENFRSRRVPSWLWRSFYPVHLVLLALGEHMLK